MSIELDLTRTLIVALLVLFAGTFLTQRIPFLLRYSIPVPWTTSPAVRCCKRCSCSIPLHPAAQRFYA